MFEEPARTRPPRTVNVTFWLDSSERWVLEQAARRSGRSVSSFIRHALGQAINDTTSADSAPDAEAPRP
jgi:uncharacterized protein (DUF1778 family)